MGCYFYIFIDGFCWHSFQFSACCFTHLHTYLIQNIQRIEQTEIKCYFTPHASNGTYTARGKKRKTIKLSHWTSTQISPQKWARPYFKAISGHPICISAKKNNLQLEIEQMSEEKKIECMWIKNEKKKKTILAIHVTQSINRTLKNCNSFP